MKYYLINLIVFIFTSSISAFAQGEIFTDQRDGKQYRIIRIGRQVWMAENLAFETENSWTYNDKKRFEKKYGRLYSWGEAVEVCPEGWHLPSDKEWTELFNYFGGEKRAGYELSITGTSGFDIRMAGFRDSTGVYYDIGNVAIFWTSKNVDENNAWRCFLSRGYPDLVQDYYSKRGGMSVRCIKD